MLALCHDEKNRRQLMAQNPHEISLGRATAA